MNEKAYNFSVLKHELLERQRHGEEDVLWKLTPEQVEFVQNVLGFCLEPEIFKVETRKIYSPGHWAPIVKRVDRANKRKQKCLFCRLTKNQKEELERHEIQYTPFKFRVFLQGSAE